MLYSYFKVYSIAFFEVISLCFIGAFLWLAFGCFPYHGCEMAGLFMGAAVIGFFVFFVSTIFLAMLLRRLDKHTNTKIVFIFLILLLSFLVLYFIFKSFLDFFTTYIFSFSYLFYILSLLVVSLDMCHPTWQLFSGSDRRLANIFGLTILIINIAGLLVIITKFTGSFYLQFSLLLLYFISQLFLGRKFLLSQDKSVNVK